MRRRRARKAERILRRGRRGRRRFPTERDRSTAALRRRRKKRRWRRRADAARPIDRWRAASLDRSLAECADLPIGRRRWLRPQEASQKPVRRCGEIPGRVWCCSQVNEWPFGREVIPGKARWPRDVSRYYGTVARLQIIQQPGAGEARQERMRAANS